MATRLVSWRAIRIAPDLALRPSFASARRRAAHRALAHSNARLVELFKSFA
jgi:hypothetical protein